MECAAQNTYTLNVPSAALIARFASSGLLMSASRSVESGMPWGTGLRSKLGSPFVGQYLM